MTTSLVLTVLGNDRPGLVEALSEIIVAHHGEWVESRMASLAGKFAGILHVSVPDDQVGALTSVLQSRQLQDLSVLVGRAVPEQTTQAYHRLVLDLVGQDRPGIMQQISQVLTRLNINVDELETGVFDASMSGERMFQAKAQLRIPQDTAIGDLRDVLEGLANELMVDIELVEDADQS